MVKKPKSFSIINRDNGEFDKCYECKEPLKNVRHLRSRPKMCASCRGDKVGGNSVIRQMFLETQKNPTEPSEDEMWFEDDPKAAKEVDLGKVSKKATQISHGMSPLSEIMSSGTPYAPRAKHGSASNGIRYTYKKDQN